MSDFDPLLYPCSACEQPPGYWCIPDWPLHTEPRVGFTHDQRTLYNTANTTTGTPAAHAQWDAAVEKDGRI